MIIAGAVALLVLASSRKSTPASAPFPDPEPEPDPLPKPPPKTGGGGSPQPEACTFTLTRMVNLLEGGEDDVGPNLLVFKGKSGDLDKAKAVADAQVAVLSVSDPGGPLKGRWVIIRACQKGDFFGVETFTLREAP